MAIGEGVLEMDAWVLKGGGKEEAILVFGVFLLIPGSVLITQIIRAWNAKRFFQSFLFLF